MKLRAILEGKQVGTLYHFTSLALAISIAIDDKFYAGYQHSSKFMSVSFTRDKNFVSSTNQRNSIGGNDIGFIVNGDKIATKYEIKPIADRMNYGDESEEIVFGKVLEREKAILNFKKYSNQILLSPQLIKKLKGEIPLIKKPTKYDYLIYQNFGDDFDSKPFNDKITIISNWFGDKGYYVK